MKIMGKLSALLFSLGLVSAGAGTSVQATSADMEKFSNITDITPIILQENMSQQISFEKHLNFSSEPFDNAMGVYHTSHYSHTSHRSHYSHYSSRY